MSEYAAAENDSSRLDFPNWIGTVVEAVFLLGTERNSAEDKLFGTVYAPLLQNLNSYQWRPNLINFAADPNETVLSTSYYLIRLFAQNQFNATLPTSADEKYGPAYWAAGETKEHLIFKAVVYESDGEVPVTVTFPGVTDGIEANLTVLTAENEVSYNHPGKVDVVEEHNDILEALDDSAFQFSLPNLPTDVLVVEK